MIDPSSDTTRCSCSYSRTDVRVWRFSEFQLFNMSYGKKVLH